VTDRVRVLHLEPEQFDPDERAPVEAVADVDYVDHASVADQAALRRVLAAGSYDAIFARVGLAIGADEVAAAPGLRWVVTPTTGLDHLDLTALDAAGVTVISLRGAHDLLRDVHATAEHAWGLVLALLRHTVASSADVMEGWWRRERFLGTELHGRTLGVLGCGRLGRMVAGYGLAFGMQVVAHDDDPDAPGDAPEGVRFVGLDDLFATADVISVHLPLDDRTRGLVDAARLGLVRPGTWLVNTARGEIVDDDALLDALASGRLAGAALDVVADDSVWPGRVPADQRLVAYARDNTNLLITPHLGGYTAQSRAATQRWVGEAFARAVREAAGDAVAHPE
jgi:D-3-phosphoglycerate dehydrogenase